MSMLPISRAAAKNIRERIDLEALQLHLCAAYYGIDELVDALTPTEDAEELLEQAAAGCQDQHEYTLCLEDLVRSLCGGRS